ncbi:TIGR03749 family integrating conjugative element protein [Salinisphaera orenii]|uniref:TIGR03749 family integrating conjugative element protein n=1 Tax=Salinisphaera orenii TaxID=856731 RepID=UPI000DBE576A
MTGTHRAAHWLLLGLVVLCVLAATPANATDVRHWQRKPIDITLPVGQERIVVLGTPVRVGLPGKLAQADKLRVQSTGGAIYLKARQSFDATRVQLQAVHNGRVILLDLSAEQHAPRSRIRIVGGGAGDSQPATSEGRNNNPGHSDRRAARQAPDPAQSGGAPLPVRLVRHAAQALYAPHRLIQETPGVSRTRLHTDRHLPGLLPSLPVEAKPLAAWHGGGESVTAIQVTNTAAGRRFDLDPQALAGDFVAASFMQHTLGPADSATATTTVFVVTDNGGLRQATGPTHAQPETDDGGD